MRSREIQKFLSSITGRTMGEIDQRTRQLRSAMQITSGARGPRAPHMDEVEAGYHILSLASRRVGDALDVAVALSKCKLVPHPDYPDLTAGFIKQDHGGEFIQVLLAEAIGTLSQIGFNVKYVEMDEGGNFAFIHMDRRSIKNIRFLFINEETFGDKDGATPSEIYKIVDEESAGNRFVISANYIQSLMNKVKGESREAVSASALGGSAAGE